MITSKWAVGFHDRGLGHGDYGVIVEQTEEVVVPSISKEMAEHLVEAHNRTITGEWDLLDIIKYAARVMHPMFNPDRHTSVGQDVAFAAIRAAAGEPLDKWEEISLERHTQDGKIRP